MCHKGSSIHAGYVVSIGAGSALIPISHYVAFIRKQIPHEQSPSWILFNDEKVAQAVDVEDMKKFAYVYFFRRL